VSDDFSILDRIAGTQNEKMGVVSRGLPPWAAEHEATVDDLLEKFCSYLNSSSLFSADGTVQYTVQAMPTKTLATESGRTWFVSILEDGTTGDSTTEGAGGACASTAPKHIISVHIPYLSLDGNKVQTSIPTRAMAGNVTLWPANDELSSDRFSRENFRDHLIGVLNIAIRGGTS